MVIHSGGCRGADFLFGAFGVSHGVSVVHHSFSGHFLPSGLSGSVLRHSPLELAAAFSSASSLASRFGFSLPSRSVSVSLISRNLLLAGSVSAVFCVAPLSGSFVSGGSRWACALGVSRGIPVFVFDYGQSDQWFRFCSTADGFLPLAGVPCFSSFSSVACIGSRRVLALPSPFNISWGDKSPNEILPAGGSYSSLVQLSF